MSSLSTITCNECGHVNEGDRVYCHGCSAKLNRDLVVPPPAPAPKKNWFKMPKVKFKGPIFPNFWNNLAKAILLAAIVAALILAAQAPDNIPEVPEEPAPPINTVLENLIKFPMKQTHKGFSESEVNAYLLKGTFHQVPEWITGFLTLKRLFVNLDPNSSRLGVEASLWGYPLCAGFTGKVQSTGPGTLTPACTGGFIGRLHIPAFAAQYAMSVVPVLMDSFKDDLERLNQIGAVDIAPEKLILTAPGKTPLR